MVLPCRAHLQALLLQYPAHSATNLFQHVKQRHAAEWEKCRSQRNENSRSTSTTNKVKQATSGCFIVPSAASD
uniref:Uncharacterized protein n=1 Tax=Paramormyrops kingsleyae TaxID=1676925 RepID=A0A3B3T827_9TELE